MIGPSLPPTNALQKYFLLLIGCTVLGVFFFWFTHYSVTGQLPSFALDTKKYVLAISISNLLGFTVFQIDHLLDKIIRWKNNFLLRFISGLGANMILTVLFLSVSGNYFLHSSNEEILKITILFIIAVFIYEIFYGLFYSYRYYAVTQAEQLQSERWQLELQFESLKSQISPHYLFNCLNTVSSLLYKDTRVAEEFIRRMADTFRYVITHQTEKLVTLRQELEFVKSYYFLLQVRFEYHLQLEINVPQNIMDSLIPPMTLQLLVENAVKHNAVNKDQPLLVYISAKDNISLIVYNTKTSSLKPVSSFRVGLDNIHKRYSFFTREKVIVRDEDKFFVQLPVLKKGTASISKGV